MIDRESHQYEPNDGIEADLTDLSVEPEELVSADEHAADGDLEPIPFDSDDPCFSWTKGQQTSQVPMVIIDSDLKVRWRNDAYSRFRETPGLSYNYRDRTFDDFFSTFAAGSPQAKIARTGFIESLANPDTCYSWQGPVEGMGPKLRWFMARLSVFPHSVDAEGSPRSYLAVLDNITSAYQDVLHGSFEGILKASLLKDEDTGNHVKRVNAYSRYLAECLAGEKSRGDVRWIDIDEDFVEDIGNLAAFHDVGKIGTPESILLKAGKLTDEEWDVMKEHPINGALLLASYPNPMAQEIARSHHERWDGSGYPFSVAGEEIPLVGRIVALADVYDALRTRRPYKEPYGEEETVDIVMAGAGSHFDPGIVDCFLRIREEFDRVFRDMAD